MKAFILAIAVFVVAEARYKRATPDLRSKFSEVKAQTKPEWDQFYSKLTTVLGDHKGDFEKALEANKGNMDLTLEQFKGKLSTNYPQISQKWGQVKTKFDQQIDNMDETTIRDVFNYVKQNAEKVLGRPLTEENVQEFVGNLKDYFVVYYQRLGQTW